MLELKNTPNGKLVSSRELYKKITSTPTYYLRWANSNIKYLGIVDVDYFTGYQIITIKNRSYPEILISLEFARSLCFLKKTKQALKIREWLFECELTTTN